MLLLGLELSFFSSGFLVSSLEGGLSSGFVVEGVGLAIPRADNYDFTPLFAGVNFEVSLFPSVLLAVYATDGFLSPNDPILD